MKINETLPKTKNCGKIIQEGRWHVVGIMSNYETK